jgi:AraC-like DNA-binding protein
MATEKSPYEEEAELEDEVYEELVLLLALSFVFGSSNIINSQFTISDFDTSQERFKTKLSEILPLLSNVSLSSIQVGVSRTQVENKIKDLSTDFSDARFQNLINFIFNDNTERMLQTNRSMFQELLRIASVRGWSDAELARRFKLYYGLTPRFLRTVISMEDALIKEGISKKTISDKVQKRVDQLVQVRLSLAATLVGTQVVEGSKDESFKHLVETGQIDSNQYVKSWESVIDISTTEICTSSHKMTAEITGVFANGYSHPPALNPVHPCRSSMRIIKRPN